MNRRTTLLGAIALLPLPLAACPGTTPAQVATDVAAGTQAATAITGIVAALQGACTGLTAPQVTACASAVQTGIATLDAQAASLSATSGSSQIAAAVTAVTGVFNDLSPYVSDIAALAPLLALVRNDSVFPVRLNDGHTYVWEDGTRSRDADGFAALAQTTTPAVKLDPKRHAQLAQHLHGLAAALAKAKAAELPSK